MTFTNGCKHKLGADETEITMVKIDGPKGQVHIKFRDNNRLQDVLNLTKRLVEYRHTNGEISMVMIETTWMNKRKLRIANLPRGTE